MEQILGTIYCRKSRYGQYQSYWDLGDILGIAQNHGVVLDATLETPLIISRVMRFTLAEPVDLAVPGTNAHWLYQFSTPRLQNSRLCFPEHWGNERFEPIGNLFMVPADHNLHARGDSGNFGAIICQLHPESVQRWFEDNMHWSATDLEAGLNIRNHHIRYLLQRLEEETRNPGFASTALAELIANQLVIELAKYFQSFNAQQKKCALEAWRLRLIDERIDDFREAPSLTELAQLCSVSVRFLTRAFRAARGCSIGDYISRRRMEKAKELLELGESVKSVAYSLGFSSPAAFGYAFRRMTGEPPGEYSRRAR